jgi:hypothetical protein
MPPPLPPDLFGGYNVKDKFLPYFNFAEEFDFGLEVSGAPDAAYFAGNVDYHRMSVTCIHDDVAAPSVQSARKNAAQTASTEFIL